MTTGLAVTGGADCGARGEVATLVGAGFSAGIGFETPLTTGTTGDDEDDGADGVAAVVPVLESPELGLPELALITRSVIGVSTDGGSIGGLRVTGLLAMLLTGLAAGLVPAGLLTGGSQVVTKKLSARLRLCSSCPRRRASAEVGNLPTRTRYRIPLPGTSLLTR